MKKETKFKVRELTRNMCNSMSRQELDNFTRMCGKGGAYWIEAANVEFSRLRSIAESCGNINGKDGRAHKNALVEALCQYGNYVRLAKEVCELVKEGGK